MGFSSVVDTSDRDCLVGENVRDVDKIQKLRNIYQSTVISGHMIPSSQKTFGYDQYPTEEREQRSTVKVWQNHSFTIRKEAVPVASSGEG